MPIEKKLRMNREIQQIGKILFERTILLEFIGEQLTSSDRWNTTTVISTSNNAFSHWINQLIVMESFIIKLRYTTKDTQKYINVLNIIWRDQFDYFENNDEKRKYWQKL